MDNSVVTKKKFQAAFISFIISVIVLSLKTKAYYETNSIAVLSDALETVVNVITAVMALWAVKMASEPADANHPYGHGKMENFSAAFEGGLIFFAALAILFQSIESFFVPVHIQNISEGFKYLGLATLLNLLVGLHLYWTGQRQKSEALKASGKHVLSDVVTTVGIFIGLFLVKLTGLQWIDAVVGLVLGLWLGYEAYQVLRSNSGALLDETDDASLEKLAEIMAKHRTPGIIDIHHLRMIRSGNFHHIDAHLVVPEFWGVLQAHVVAHEFEKSVVAEYEYDGEFAFHTDPCQKLYCSTCAVENCKIRISPYTYRRELTKEHMIKGPQYTV
jgi:cation diffusion facilitator family transporter